MEEWKIDDRCFIMTKEGKPMKCVINRPFVLVKMWVLSNGNGYWGPVKEEDMFRTKKELLSHYYTS